MTNFVGSTKKPRKIIGTSKHESKRKLKVKGAKNSFGATRFLV
jgi:hypothetical protein